MSKEKYPYQPDEINGTSIEIVIGFWAIIIIAIVSILYYLTPLEYQPIFKRFIGYVAIAGTILFVALMGASRSSKDYH